MVPLSKFNSIIYKKPKVFRYDHSIVNIVGFDSEAYQSGTTFVFCTSLGDAIAPDDLIKTLFSDKYAGSNFVCWNLKYDSGAILKVFPRYVLKALQENHSTVHVVNGVKYQIQYIPHKRLLIKEADVFHPKSVRFWDVSPFYGRPKLAMAAKEHLGESKDDINPELFTVDYVEAHFTEIVKYCVQDALLTKKLADLWIDKFQQTGVPVTSLYSEASISFSYISRKTDIVTPYEYWDCNRKMVQYAFESYEGGKFEILARGKFTGMEFDISSAYPYEIANLIDIRGAEIRYGKKYCAEAVYGFIRCRISVNDPLARLPCGIFNRLRVYPVGTYFLTITKQEFDYLLAEVPSVHIDIYDAAWIVVNAYRYPYRAVMDELYEAKTYWKKKDRIRSNNYKVIMNGFYGKMAQCIAQLDGSYMAGQGWNPIYASVITANTRIAVTRLQNILGRDCLAVHTDSVISRKEIPKRLIGSKLGQFELVEQGDGVLIACGIYEINGVSALKGFGKRPLSESCGACKLKKTCSYSYKSIECKGHHIRSGYLLKDMTLTEVLQENPGKKRIDFKLRHVESWLQSMAQGHSVDTINLFSDLPKTFTLNCDTKRVWPDDITTDDLLQSLQFSQPLIEHQNEPPYYWRE